MTLRNELEIIENLFELGLINDKERKEKRNKAFQYFRNLNTKFNG